jgi:hypothetical protein
VTPAVLIATFPCTSCQKAYPAELEHESGYCHGCIEKGRRFWLARYSVEELVELAHMIWDDVPRVEELAA